MQDNIYAPPAASLVKEPDASVAQFYVVSKKKFYILFIMTMGLYMVYWFYRNW